MYYGSQFFIRGLRRKYGKQEIRKPIINKG